MELGRLLTINGCTKPTRRVQPSTMAPAIRQARIATRGVSVLLPSQVGCLV